MLFTSCVKESIRDENNEQKLIIEIRSFQVNIQSPSEAVGLQAGDVILAVNGMDLSGLKHKEAQEKIVKSGNNFQMTILRLFDVQGLKIRHRTLT